MRNRLMGFAVAAATVVAASGAALAQICPPGYALAGGVCQPAAAYAPNNPVSGAASGMASGAASGNAAAGPVGAIVGGAIGTATGTLAGTTNMVTGAPVATTGSSVPPAAVCPPGSMLYQGACYAAR